MKNLSTGFGLAVLGVGIGLHAFNPQIAAQAQQPTESAACGVAAAVAAKAGAPTVVWYGSGFATTDLGGGAAFSLVYRAWSDGTLEMKRVVPSTVPSNISPGNWCDGQYGTCSSPWFVISSPTEGLNAASDVNHDETVDGADLATLLGAWGPAPRGQFPPSDCPLNLAIP